MRITSQNQAEREYHKHHEHQQAITRPDIDASPAHVDRAVTGQGMDGIEVSPDQLRAADQQLAVAQQELADHLRTAQQLHGPLGDGSGPVAHTMRAAFLDRASTDGGVQFALQNYIDELTNVRMAIAQTLATYETVETDIAGDFGRTIEGQA